MSDAPSDRGPGAPLDRLALLADCQSAFLASALLVEPQAPVPWCGRWRVHHLVVHLARIHHWAAAQARGTPEVPLGRGPLDHVELYARCAAELHATLTELAPDHLGSTLLGRGPASFWHRRQLHETLVHLWDLRTAGALAGEEPAWLWADTVDEVVTILQPRQVRLERMPQPARPVRLTAPDAERTWLLGVAPEEAGHERAGADGTGDVEVSGRAQDLALMLWRRRTPEELGLTVDGEPAALRDLLEHALTP